MGGYAILLIRIPSCIHTVLGNLVSRPPAQTLSRSRGEKSTFLHGCEISTFLHGYEIKSGREAWRPGYEVSVRLMPCSHTPLGCTYMYV